jgi:hypothetical protein
LWFTKLHPYPLTHQILIITTQGQGQRGRNHPPLPEKMTSSLWPTAGPRPELLLYLDFPQCQLSSVALAESLPLDYPELNPSSHFTAPSQVSTRVDSAWVSVWPWLVSCPTLAPTVWSPISSQAIPVKQHSGLSLLETS